MTQKISSTYIVLAIFAIVIVIILFLMTRKKEEEEDENGDDGNGGHVPPFEEDHPGYTGSVWVEEYKGYDIWYWAGKPNPYIVETTIRQWFETIVQARNRISDHVGF